MAKRIANNKCAEYIATLKEFQGSNLRGEIVAGRYEIYSYWTKMAEIDINAGAYWINENKYSQTTSRQMTYVRKGIQDLLAPIEG
jgi:hypothetical protein